MGSYCRACGYRLQEYESKNVCPMCGSTKIRHDRNISKKIKHIGIGVFLVFVLFLIAGGISSTMNDEPESIDENQTPLVSQNPNFLSENTGNIIISDKNLLEKLNSFPEYAIGHCIAGLDTEHDIVVDCPKYNRATFHTDLIFSGNAWSALREYPNNYAIIIHDRGEYSLEIRTGSGTSKIKGLVPVETKNMISSQENDIKNNELGFEKSIVNEDFQTNQNPESKELQTAMEIHRLVNIERHENGLKSLTYDSALADIARLHSEDMAKRKFFSHENPDGQDHTIRALNADYKCENHIGDVIYGLGENLHMKSGSTITFWDSPESIAKDTVEGWMNSPPHRENILRTHFGSEGIGIEITTFEIYVTQLFC